MVFSEAYNIDSFWDDEARGLTFACDLNPVLGAGAEAYCRLQQCSWLHCVCEALCYVGFWDT